MADRVERVMRGAGTSRSSSTRSGRSVTQSSSVRAGSAVLTTSRVAGVGQSGLDKLTVLTGAVDKQQAHVGELGHLRCVLDVRNSVGVARGRRS